MIITLPKCKCGAAVGLSFYDDCYWCPDCMWAEIVRLRVKLQTARGSRWKCTTCGCEFPANTLDDGVVRCSKCVEVEMLRDALARSPYDICPCIECGLPVVCCPEGVTICNDCEAAEAKGSR